MSRAGSSRRVGGKYEKLGKEGCGSGGDESEKEELKSLASTREIGSGSSSVQGQSHPIFSFMHFAGKKKAATARPEMVRYAEYLKEGGMWDLDSNQPVIYYK